LWQALFSHSIFSLAIIALIAGGTTALILVKALDGVFVPSDVVRSGLVSSIAPAFIAVVVLYSVNSHFVALLNHADRCRGIQKTQGEYSYLPVQQGTSATSPRNLLHHEGLSCNIIADITHNTIFLGTLIAHALIIP